jgi:PP-loop superfamily ATP-utilizing enzyme
VALGARWWLTPVESIPRSSPGLPIRFWATICWAVIADSASLARSQLADAIAFAREQGIPLEVIATAELDRPEYIRNDASRCFHCKDELFTVMESFRLAHDFHSIAYGVNVDDQGDFRPGQAAARTSCCRLPLKLANQAGSSRVARTLGRVWEKPVSVCLSLRIGTGEQSPVKCSTSSNKARMHCASSAFASFVSAIMVTLSASKLRAMN